MLQHIILLCTNCLISTIVTSTILGFNNWNFSVYFTAFVCCTVVWLLMENMCMYKNSINKIIVYDELLQIQRQKNNEYIQKLETELVLMHSRSNYLDLENKKLLEQLHDANIFCPGHRQLFSMHTEENEENNVSGDEKSSHDENSILEGVSDSLSSSTNSENE
jgi:hypothetical protein